MPLISFQRFMNEDGIERNEWNPGEWMRTDGNRETMAEKRSPFEKCPSGWTFDIRWFSCDTGGQNHTSM